jgi:hypothetical protein
VKAGAFHLVFCVGLVVLVSVGAVSAAGGSPFRSDDKGDNVDFRMVLCVVAPYDSSSQPVPGRLSASSCAPDSLLSTNLGVSPSDNSAGYTVNTVPLDTTLSGTSSTKPSAGFASRTVLLPGLGASGSENRYLLGPVQMSGTSFAKAVVHYQESDKQWIVNITMTGRGAALWNKVARTDFHQELAIVVNGIVVSSPLIQPTQSAFSSFGGEASIAGAGIGHREALRIASTISRK